ncbi:Ecdysteroid UDP-glucosyltransferase [Eumeta japonica]|uniref:Ecdysteroid UDP-glucosyltransferase n=1 Tax=Eumeta variegata TaxID=151549 RepID=A0A4C1TM00_EUMVA|nr:Ecdysteroid UDP-glucosyltransferase [Eumeta japonica]
MIKTEDGAGNVINEKGAALGVQPKTREQERNRYRFEIRMESKRNDDSLVHEDEAAKILAVFPLPGPSHGILGNGYVEHLLNAGHEVTYVTPFPRKDPPPNLHQVVIEYPPEINPIDLFTIEMVMKKEIDVKDLSWMFTLIYGITEYFIKCEPVQELINDPKHTFDLAIIEWLFIELSAGFAPLFQCPLIWASSMEPHWMVLQLVDEASNPAYMADSMSNNAPPFTFLERVEELWAQMKITVIMK